MEQTANIIVIGGGHAGCEAALAAARMGCSVILVSMRRDRLAEMSCNPSIGGVGKGQLVRELDALGGEMGKNADYTGIQFKRLNTRKGSAVQSSRCQSDKIEYARRMTSILSSEPNIRIMEAEAKAVIVDGGRAVGAICRTTPVGVELELIGDAVVLTAGTFMGAVMHCGFQESSGGRFGEGSSNGLSDSLRELGLRILRLKTGTPARLKRDSIDFSLLTEQPGDPVPTRFSFCDSKIMLPQVSCHLGYTSALTHEIIRKNLDRSPLYSGKISGVGPRYCPSIEDKVVKFPDKPQHHVFFEPESLSSDWIYPNGISTSLPGDVQELFIKTLPGCQNVEILRSGYAVEYDCIDPTQLDHSFQCRTIKGLFLGGQVNGTSGYEEAAIQGLFAGINAVQFVTARPPFLIARSEAYLGVLVDDLVTRGITEPYRMFTSRSEYRLSIREDNADARLTPKGMELGLVGRDQRDRFVTKMGELKRARVFLANTVIKPSDIVSRYSIKKGFSAISAPVSAKNLLKRPEYGIFDITSLCESDLGIDPNNLETLEIEIKYEGYISIQLEEIARLKRLTEMALPADLPYEKVAGLSREVCEKLSRRRPSSLAEASGISGITPAALTAIVSHLNRRAAHDVRV